MFVGVAQIRATLHAAAVAPLAVQFRGTNRVGGHPFSVVIGIARIGAGSLKSGFAFVQPDGKLQPVFSYGARPGIRLGKTAAAFR